jgi:hypothetical protein
MHEEDDRQGSLFGGDAFGPPARPRPEATARPVSAPPANSAPPEDLATPPEAIVSPEDLATPPEAITAPEDLAPPPEAITAPAPPEDVLVPPEAVAAREAAAPTSREFAVPDDGAEEIRVSRTAGFALTGPTLDDAVSRAWEGLVARVPAACPVCHGEIEPALGGALRGHCRTCHVTLD